MVAATLSADSPHVTSGTLSFQPLCESSSTEVDFGVDAGVLDIPNLSDDEFAELERAVLTQQVVVVRGQKKLAPRDQFELTRRFDPEVKTYGHGNSKITTLPLVWVNPATGRRALQLHAYCVEQVLVDGEPVGTLAECRKRLYELMRPAIAPSRVYAHAWREGDLVIFNNRGLWHTVVGSLGPNDVRVYHQCNLASIEPPIGAVA